MRVFIAVDNVYFDLVFVRKEILAVSPPLFVVLFRFLMSFLRVAVRTFEITSCRFVGAKCGREIAKSNKMRKISLIF